MGRVRFAAAAAVLPLVLVSCASNKDAFVVTATDTTCEIGTTHFDAGKLAFEVHNEGSKTTELYVYGKGDKIMGEVENVGPGTARTLTVDLRKGAYALACKPGQTGDGIRRKITVSGEGGAAEKAPDREIEVKAVDYRFEAPAALRSIEKGETIEFELENEGTVEHEFEVLRPDGDALGEVGPTKPGAKGDVVLTFDEAGDYTFVCGIDDHEKRGMKGSFTVG